MKALIFVTCLLHMCTGDILRIPVDPINDNIPVSEDDDLNSVYKNPIDVKISSSEDSVRNLETSTTYIPIFSKKQNPGDGHSDSSDDRYTTKANMHTVQNENTPLDISEVKPISQEQEAPGIYEPGLPVEKDSKLSDIPADEPVLPNAAETTIVPGDEKQTVQSEEESPTQTAFIPSREPDQTVVEEETSTQDETSAGSSVPALGESSDQPEIGGTSRPESGEPVQTTEVPFSVDDMNKRKGSGSAVTTEKSSQPDTPPYPPLPSIPTDEEGILHPRPPVKKGQLDIRISIPHIFHLSLGDTPDGRRRLGIQAPFFKLDLTKPLFKVFQK